MSTVVTNASLSRPNLLKAGAKVLAVLLIAATLVWVGRSSVKTKSTETQTSREITIKLDETKLNKIENDIITKIHEESVASSKGSYAAAGKTNSTSTTKIVETVRTVVLDPVTGKIISTTDTNRVVDSGKAKNAESSASADTSTNASITKTTDVADKTKTTEATITKTSTTDVTKEHTKTTEGPVAVANPSPIGVAIDITGRPQATYDMIHIMKLAAGPNAEINLKKLGVRAIGLHLSADVNRRRDYFVGAYGQYVFENKDTEYGIMFGRRF